MFEDRIMALRVHVEPVDHTQRDIARRIHAVQQRAYAQEAALLGVRQFPPLERTVDDVMAATEMFHAAFMGDELIGALGLVTESSGDEATIASLVVAPAFQRRGVGRALIEAVLAAHPRVTFFVETGVKNVPALSLYARYGFTEIERWFVGDEPLELVRLRRAPR